jgi:hypothetical protein
VIKGGGGILQGVKKIKLKYKFGRENGDRGSENLSLKLTWNGVRRM